MTSSYDTKVKVKVKIKSKQAVEAYRVVMLRIPHCLDQWFSNFFRPPPTWPSAFVLSAPLNYPILIFKI
jgi:hypothetical protein